MAGMGLQRLTWKETLSLIRADRQRLRGWSTAGSAAPHPAGPLSPSFLCVLFYRLSHHCHRAGHRYIARLLWHANALLTGADISEPAKIGAGLVVLSPPGTAIMCTAGRNLTLMPCSGIGGEVGRHADVGAGPGLPLLGDDVTLEPHAGVLGPVKVGSRVVIPAGITVTEDVPDDVTIEGPRLRFFRRRDLE